MKAFTQLKNKAFYGNNIIEIFYTLLLEFGMI